MTEQNLDVALARLDGRLDTLQQTIELRLDSAQTAAEKAKEIAHEGDQRLGEEGVRMRDEFRSEILDLRAVVEDLRRWQARLIGVGVGVSLMSGLVSGLVVLLLSSS